MKESIQIYWTGIIYLKKKVGLVLYE